MNVQAMTCRRTFDFVWSKEKNLKLQINQQHTGKIDIKHQQQILMIASGVKYGRACSQWDTSQCPCT